MKRFTVEGYANMEKGELITVWEVKGNNVIPCMNDIKNNARYELDDYTTKMFDQRYGCTAKILYQVGQQEERQIIIKS